MEVAENFTSWVAIGYISSILQSYYVYLLGRRSGEGRARLRCVFPGLGWPAAHHTHSPPFPVNLGECNQGPVQIFNTHLPPPHLGWVVWLALWQPNRETWIAICRQNSTSYSLYHHKPISHPPVVSAYGWTQASPTCEMRKAVWPRPASWL